MLICKKVQVSAHDNAVLAYPACGDGSIGVKERGVNRDRRLNGVVCAYWSGCAVLAGWL